MLKPGDTAPDFSLESTSGKRVALSDLRGRKVILYFYPKDDTPGCTRQACDFRDNYKQSQSANTVVYGVSRDNLDKHAKFRAKYSLPFDLLTDPDSKVATAYGAYGEKKLYGVTSVGTIRTTVLIDENGRIQNVWPKVKVDGHVNKVITMLKGEKATSTGENGGIINTIKGVVRKIANEVRKAPAKKTKAKVAKKAAAKPVKAAAKAKPAAKRSATKKSKPATTAKAPARKTTRTSKKTVAKAKR